MTYIRDTNIKSNPGSRDDRDNGSLQSKQGSLENLGLIVSGREIKSNSEMLEGSIRSGR